MNLRKNMNIYSTLNNHDLSTVILVEQRRLSNRHDNDRLIARAAQYKHKYLLDDKLKSLEVPS